MVSFSLASQHAWPIPVAAWDAVGVVTRVSGSTAWSELLLQTLLKAATCLLRDKEGGVVLFLKYPKEPTMTLGDWGFQYKQSRPRGEAECS